MIHDGPAYDVIPLEMSDTNDLSQEARGFLAADDSVIHAITAAGQDRTFPIFKGYNPIRVKKVFTDSVLGGAVYLLI